MLSILFAGDHNFVGNIDWVVQMLNRVGGVSGWRRIRTLTLNFFTSQATPVLYCTVSSLSEGR